MQLPYESAVLILSIFSEKLVFISHRNLDKNVHRSFIHDDQKSETTFNGQMVKEIAIHPFQGILLVHSMMMSVAIKAQDGG